VLPFAKWQWVNATPEVRRLKPFEASGVEKIARVTYDFDTHLRYAEIFHGGAWMRVRLFEDDDSEINISGVIKGSDRYVVRLSYSSRRILPAGDEIWAPTFAEVADEKGRDERALKEAQDDTARCASTGGRARRRVRAAARRHQEGEVGAAPPPRSSRASCASGDRRGAASAVRGRSQGPALVAGVARFTGAALTNRCACTDGVRGRDPKGASAAVDALAADPDTRALADYLKATKDWFRNLPTAGRS
jgi:hypothetical protein